VSGASASGTVTVGLAIGAGLRSNESAAVWGGTAASRAFDGGGI